ncbi:uncharacterized protein [Pagrus major]|uniref:uncharacterized protein n=1 Tax=Pagrus major TaxID=143350 RepID=UPI003CC8A3C2
MSDKLRTLPPWMAKRGGKVKEEPLKRRRKPKTARAAFYLMNEKELVEAAVSFLTDASCDDLPGRKVEDEAADTTVKRKENPAASKTTEEPVAEPLEESSSDSGDAQDATCISETDLDITEVETLPYTRSLQHRGPEGQRSGPVQDHGNLMKVELEAEKKQEHSQLPADAAEEDDALRLVREIFFT